VQKSFKTTTLNILKSMRPFHCYKNVVVFLAILFGSKFLIWRDWGLSIAAFAVFCLLCGATYLLNDILDRKADREHPRKKLRPIASGELSVGLASTVAFLTLVIALVGAWFINWQFLACAGGYVILQLVYSLGLKRIFLVDILSISLGFVLRAIAGALAIDVVVSPWLVICVFLLALVLALTKRKGELSNLGDTAHKHRSTLGQYDGETIIYLLNISATSLFVSYLLYAASFEHTHMLVTVPFVTYCLFRYVYVVRHKRGANESAERVFLDWPMMVALACWAISVAVVLEWWK
jgi:4-hydroxybenzoate polyprenyltransferase